MFDNLRRDFPKYTIYGRWYTDSGFWIVLIYRFGMWADSLPGILNVPLGLLYRLLKLPFRSNHVSLWAGRRGAHIGAGLRLIHPTNVLIGRGVVIGKDCLIFNDVTLGTAGQRPGMPKVGDNVAIYPGARVLGGIVIGDNTIIGANCVVVRDIPANSVMLNTAGRVIPRALSPVARAADQRLTRTGQILG